MSKDLTLAEWTTAKVNDLPDSSFLYVAPGGEKDGDGKTKPRSLRYFPFKDAAGKVDLPHLRNAIGRIPQSTAPGLTKEKMRSLQDKARNLLRAESEDMAEKDEEPEFEEIKVTAEKDEEGKIQNVPGKTGPHGGGRKLAKQEDEDKGTGEVRKVGPWQYAEVFHCAPYLLSGDQSWVEVVRSGKFYGNTGPKPRQIELTEEDIYSMARTYAQVLTEEWFSAGAPVGYNHAQAMGDRTPEATRAAARIQQVEVRPNDHGGVSLWGLFAWTEEGARRIRAEEFSSVSAEIIPPSAATSKLTGQPMGGWTLVGASLTATPFVPGMQAPSLSGTVAAGEEFTDRIYLTEVAPGTQEKPSMSDFIVKLAEATGLPSEAPELLSEVRRLQELASKVEPLAEAVETATKEIESLRTRNTLLEDREKTRALDDACSIGRIAPTEREDYWQIVETLGEEKAQRMFDEGRIKVVGDRVTPEQAAAEAAPSDAADAFVVLMDRFVSEGKTETEAWQLAAQANGSTLYAEEN